MTNALSTQNSSTESEITVQARYDYIR